MKRIILFLFAATVLSFGWIAQAAEATDDNSAYEPAAEAAAVPMETTPEAVAVDAAPVSQPPSADSERYRPPVVQQFRPQTLDLRHCLELGSNAEIARCAGE
jgi:hypothetical protein